MATYLALCQQLASDSGTLGDGTALTAVTGQTGRKAKMVGWVNRAWRSIQNAHPAWRWMRSEFSGSTVSGTRAYSGSDLGVASRFGDFICSGEGEQRFSIYLTATGVADEGRLFFKDYDWFYTNCMRGSQTNSRPAYFTITPDGELALHPIPDAAYTVRGPYRKDVQELTADGDIPEMPVRYHDLIVDVAMMMLQGHDEALNQIPLTRLRMLPRFAELEHDQLPRIRLAGPLA